MLAQERYKLIIDVLEEEKSVRVSQLMKLFDVSIETVRRDLEYLDRKGCLKRVYGGAVLEKADAKLGNFKTRKNEYVDEKKEIANIAARYVTEGQSIAMDYGTTTLEVARAVKRNIKKLTVLTNSLAIANELIDMEKYTIIFCGGILKNDELSVVGDLAIENIGKFHIDTAFISVSGLSLKGGITDYVFDDIHIQKKMIDISEKTIILANSSKFDTVSLLKVCNFSQIDTIITDSKLNPDILKRYRKNGIDVVNR